MASKIVTHALRVSPEPVQTEGMSRKARANPKPKRRKTFIRQWRKVRGLTLLQMADRLKTELDLEISDGQLSRIERGDQPYSQDLLEAFAAVLRCDPADLLVRDPSQPEGIWSIWDQLQPVERAQVVEVAKVLRKTGTEG